MCLLVAPTTGSGYWPTLLSIGNRAIRRGRWQHVGRQPRLLLARRFNARYAVMLVHSFSPTAAWFADFQAFVGLFGVLATERNVLLPLAVCEGISLYTGWVMGDPAYLQA